MTFEIKRAHGKTAVFSGVRHHTDHIPKLEELCIQRLLDNVNQIECVGDVPYYVLKPLLTKISVSQLQRIESYNPHIVEDIDSDEPWKVHCLRAFKGRVPGKGETWRNLYHKCEREREHKIEKIAKKIKKHEKKATPARQARIVTQQLPGGKSRAIATTTVITKTIKNHLPTSSSSQTSAGGSSKGAGSASTSTVIVKHSSANGSQSNTTKLKQKTAPLMQKSMQLFKSRFRR